MRTSRRTRDVLGDKAGLSTSIIDTLAGVSLKTIVIVMVGGLLSVLLAFWAVSSASADTSSGFQTSNLKFEKSVSASNVVVGVDAKKVGLLKDTADGKCVVETWQSGSRDGKTTLQVDTKTVAGVCAPTTSLVAAGAGEVSSEPLFGIEAPVFKYQNIGGREIKFNASGTPSLVTGAKPADVKVADWDDVRPYQVTLKVAKLDTNTAQVAKKAVLTAHTNVINVTAAEDDLRFVPSPSSDPIPGPVRITGVERSATTGTVFSGTREGIAVTFAGGVCPSPSQTRVNVSYTQQGPSAKPPVNTIVGPVVLTGAATTVHLGSVANGSSGAVEVAATCVGGSVAEKASTGYTQDIPATTLTVKQNAAPEKHDLSWIPVSSLPTSFELRWTVGSKNNELLTTTNGLAFQSVNAVGGNLGLTSTYTVVATIDSNQSPVATANITNPLPQAPAAVLTSNATGASWTAIACTPGATAEYASRYHQQAGTSTAVAWTPLTAWSKTDRALTGVTTPAYGRTVTEVQTRCVADVSKVVSPINTSNNDSFYEPEAINVSAARSTATGTAFSGAREGMTATHTGARCYNGTQSKIDMVWQPVTPAGQTNVTSSRSIVATGAAQTVELANVKNGAVGNLVGTVTCAAGKSGSETKSAAYTQPVPAPVLTIAQNAATEKHDLTWTAVSSLPTSFQIRWSVGAKVNELLTTTTGLAYTSTNAVGGNLGYTTTYSINGTVGAISGPVDTGTISNGLKPATATVLTSNATGATWTAIACEPGTTAQYSARYYQQVGTSTAVAWSAPTAWGTGRALTGVTTPGHGRTVADVDSRCVANISGVASATAKSNWDIFYAPEAITVAAVRSAATGTAYAGAREGITVTHTGARCYNGSSSKIDISWEPATPAGQTPVTSIRTIVPTGGAQTVELADVKNGASGNLVAEATCTAGKSSTASKTAAFTQAIPAPPLNVTDGASADQHQLTWAAVSSLPTSFEVRRKVGTAAEALVATVPALTYTSTVPAGSNLGSTTTFSVIAVIGANRSPAGTDSAYTAVPRPVATVVTSNATGATWTAVTCVTGATPQYASRYYQQAGTSTAVAWTTTSAFTTGRTLTGVTTPGNGRTVTEAHTRCLANVSGVASPTNISAPDTFYAPEAINVTGVRSTTTGTAYMGLREGMTATHSGARCYNGTPSVINLAWQPATPAGQVNVTMPTKTGAVTGAATTVELSNVRNGAQGNIVGTVTCTAGKSSTATDTTAYTQTVPNPVATVTAPNGTQHVVTWAAVSSLPTSFQITKTAASGTVNATPAATTALTQTLTYPAGTNYGNKTDYKVAATVGGTTGTSALASVTTAWPTTPLAHRMSYTRTGYNGNHSSGSLAWEYNNSCAPGTSMKDRLNENRAGQLDGSYDNRTHFTSAWFDGRTSSNWGPAYAQQGYSYSVLIDVKCVSDVTGLESPLGSLQQTFFVTPMATPTAPVWDGYNYREWARGTSWTYSTGLSGPASITIDWTYSCPSGSWMNWSHYKSQSWAGNGWAHGFGFQDNWKLPDSSNHEIVYYKDAHYTCATPWSASPGSAWGATKAVNVYR